MDIDERISALQKEIGAVKRELQTLLTDIRVSLLESQSPIRTLAVNAEETDRGG